MEHLIEKILLFLGIKKLDYADWPLHFLEETERLRAAYIPFSETYRLQERYAPAVHYYGLPFRRRDPVTKAFYAEAKDLTRSVSAWNQAFIQRALDENDALFSDIDGKSLDLQQRTAILTDEDCALVVAGAGSGKTLTIAGKVEKLQNCLQN